MTVSLGKCANWRCAKPLGLMVYRISKFGRQQFCSIRCSDEYRMVSRINAQQRTYEGAKLFPSRQLDFHPLLLSKGG
jgi:hypothetical protein